MRKVLILQSNYIPWKGYFDAINMVDEFIVYDDVQYTKNDWRNRNKIKSPSGTHWLTIPVRHLSLNQKIKETQVADSSWNRKHLETIRQFYSKAPYYKSHFSFFEELYRNCKFKYLSEINHYFILTINKLVGIDTKITWATDYGLIEGKTERLVDLVEKANGNIYLTGPSASNYLNEDLFSVKEIKVEWLDYSGYKEYEQLYPPFDHAVSIIDLILSVGPQAKNYLKSFNS